jgi:hypothetical protein
MQTKRQFTKQSRSLLQLLIRCDQLKNKSSWRVTYGNPCYSTGSKANSIYFLNDRSVLFMFQINRIPTWIPDLIFKYQNTINAL